MAEGRGWEWTELPLSSRKNARSLVKLLTGKNLNNPNGWIFKSKRASSDDGKGNWWGVMRKKK